MTNSNVNRLFSYEEVDNIISKLEDGGLCTYVVFNNRRVSFDGENDLIVFEPWAENISSEIIELGLQFVKQYKSDQSFRESVVQSLINTGEVLKPGHH